MAKVGRNDPCPCGSGKKYKHCCLSKQRPSSPTDDASYHAPVDQLGQPGMSAMSEVAGDQELFEFDAEDVDESMPPDEDLDELLSSNPIALERVVARRARLRGR